MAAPENRLKARMQAAEMLTGIWIGSGAEATAEALSLVGYDWMLLDGEHGPIEVSALLPMMRAAALGGIDVVARVPWNDPVLIKRVLDIGAQTLMIPFVQNADEARAAVRAMRYPPHGIRGAAGVTRAGRYGTASDYLAGANAQVSLIAQAETAEAIACVGEIAAVDGVDAVFVGPSDLAASMGHLGHSGHPDVQTAIAQAARDILAAGKTPSILALDAAGARAYRAMGYRLIAAGLDMHLLVQAARNLLAEVRA